jgi:GntR family transcriptional regulator/MocR family aminotransferase
MNVPFILDRRATVPLHRQIYGAWRDGILSGRFRRGERVPSSRAFAGAYDVARVTVTAAYDQLLAEGYFETKRGSGTFVSSELPDEALRPARVTRVVAAAPATARLSAYGGRLGAIVQRSSSRHPINLSDSSPDLTCFPSVLWRRLVLRHLRRPSPAVFGYAVNPAGHEPLRREIARYLARARAVRCSYEQVIVVNGSQQALELCVRLLLDPGDEAAVESPGYLGARQLLAAHGARLVPLPVTTVGASLERLTERTRLVHVTPSHQFPTGVSMTLARRLELLEWARSRRAIVIEDDYDSEYRYSGPPLPAMHGLSTGANVIYLGTFSNVMFPGLRIGYLVVPPALAGPFSTAKWLADRNTAMLEQAALADFIAEGHLDRHVRRMRRIYKRRRDVLLDALARHFGDAAAIRGDAAGMHMSVRFRAAAAMQARAERQGVHLAGSGVYYLGRAPANEFLLGFSAISERMIRDGIRRLALTAGTHLPIK